MTAAGEKPRIGWLGTGRMGFAMVRRLLDAGHDVTVWNRTRAKAEPLARHGARIADSIAGLADRDIVFTVVSASRDLAQVMLGDGGLLRHAPVPRIVVDHSTVSTEVSAQVREAAWERGADFLAAPVSGNAKAVAAGGASFVVSGPEQAFQAVRPLLDQIGRAAVRVGDREEARLVKLCHNLFLGVVIDALVEVTSLAEKGGVSRTAFLEFLNRSVLGSTFTRYKTPALVNLDYTPTFTMELLRKDFDLGLAEARSLEVPMPVTSLVSQMIQTAMGHGFVDTDFAALLVVQAKAAGIDLKSENAEVGDGLEPPRRDP